MQLFDKIKSNYLRKKIAVNSERNCLELLPSESYHKILYILENESESFKEAIKKKFPGSYPHHLFIRNIKTDTAIGHNYSVHDSDFNLTGNLKNDKLIQLSKMKFDLIIDLSNNSALLNYFIHAIPASLIIGKMNAENSYLHDLFIESTGSDMDFLENIKNKITLLTENEYQSI